MEKEYWTKQGNSGFLGALVAGFAAGYLMKGLRKLFDYLPDAFEGLKPVLLYPFFGLLLMALLMTFIINPPNSSQFLSLVTSRRGE